MQAQYSCVLATLCRNGDHRKRVLSRGHSRVVCRPSTVRITPPGSSLARFPIAAQIPKAPDPWSKEAVLLALERWKRKKRTVEEEEDQTSAAGQEEKRRCHDSSGSGHSAFKPEVAVGVPAAFVPEPGPLKRGLSSQSSDGELRKRTCTSAFLYFYWRHLLALEEASQCLTLLQPSLVPLTDTRESRKENEIIGWSSGIWLFRSAGKQGVPGRTGYNHMRGILLISPPAPWISRSIMVEEYYQEKQAPSQWLKRIFEDKTATTSDFGAMTQTTSSGGSTTSSHYTSRVSAGRAGSGDFGMSMSAPHNSSTTGAFDFVAGRSGRTGGTAHFWGCLSQNSLGTAGQSTLFGIYVASTPQNTSVLAAITSGFGAVTQPTSCGTRTSGTLLGLQPSPPALEL
ncbi:Nuclear envelope pore membrane protein POM 121 [Manis javanica]|nr:Nuclear envelope pore membrane protein POM 121 [Manis javanica]